MRQFLLAISVKSNFAYFCDRDNCRKANRVSEQKRDSGIDTCVSRAGIFAQKCVSGSHYAKKAAAYSGDWKVTEKGGKIGGKLRLSHLYGVF